MTTLTFEQPLNELVRLNLRLEYLFFKFEQNIVGNDQWSLRSCLEVIAQITHVLDRPDIKSKYAKALQKQIDTLSYYIDQPVVNQKTLSNTLSELQDLVNYFSLSNDKIASNLRKNNFLNTLRQHLLCPGGDANFEMPAFNYWLNLSPAKQSQCLNSWMNDLKPVKQTVTAMLKLLRSSTKVKYAFAVQGFYQEPLESGSNTQLVTIKIYKDECVYPIVSASKHRLIFRFYDGEHIISQEQVQRDVPFEFICC